MLPLHFAFIVAYLVLRCGHYSDVSNLSKLSSYFNNSRSIITHPCTLDNKKNNGFPSLIIKFPPFFDPYGKKPFCICTWPQLTGFSHKPKNNCLLLCFAFVPVGVDIFNPFCLFFWLSRKKFIEEKIRLFKVAERQKQQVERKKAPAKEPVLFRACRFTFVFYRSCMDGLRILKCAIQQLRIWP